jgi:hypothetical protein
VKSDFDTLRFNVVPQDILECVREKTEKDTFACMIAKFAATFTGWTDPHATTKRSEVAKVGLGGMAAFEGRRGIIFTRKSIFNAQMIVESIGPEARVEASASQHGAESIADGLMRTLNRTILVGAISASSTDFISKFGKESADFGVLKKFPSLVKIHILIGYPWGVTEEPIVEPN